MKEFTFAFGNKHEVHAPKNLKALKLVPKSRSPMTFSRNLICYPGQIVFSFDFRNVAFLLKTTMVTKETYIVPFWVSCSGYMGTN